MAAQDRKERKDTMAVQERARLVSPLNFLVTNDLVRLQPNGLFRGKIATHSLTLSLSIYVSLSPSRWSRASRCVFQRRLVPIITSFEDDNFLSAARSVSLRSIRDFLCLFPRISSHLRFVGLALAAS